jgi:hypothetical protein
VVGRVGGASPINDHQPWIAVELVRSGDVDTVQVIYNVFDQSPDLALRYILSHPAVSSVIPGMRSVWSRR